MKFDATNIKDFENQFRTFLATDSAQIESVVYFFRVGEAIKRVKGASDIVYIGQTSKSFNQRYKSNKNIEIEKDCFEDFYKFAIQQYQGMRIEIQGSKHPERDEAIAFKNYFNSHLEYPPLNRSIPKRILNEQDT